MSDAAATARSQSKAGHTLTDANVSVEVADGSVKQTAVQGQEEETFT